MRCSLVVVGVLALGVCSAAAPLQTSASLNPVIGTWKQNMEKSTYSLRAGTGEGNNLSAAVRCRR